MDKSSFFLASQKASKKGLGFFQAYVMPFWGVTT